MWPVDQHLEVLPARLVVATLSGSEADLIGAGRPAADHLAEAAIPLEEGDLAALGGVEVARGEAAAVPENPSGA